MDAENLKEKRKKLGLTQIQVAKKIGVTANAYRNWEYGANEPSRENQEKLKKLFKE